ncbi:hypothetical protein GGR53DRAFT_494947 [Hypoxylon sp. FL1150]|nr:hypothetical protein GGR53DRAFT_494947 [Hypoxylon sp. FL1150]
MPITPASCALCGVLIEDVSHSSTVDSTTWLHEFRVVYTILDQWEAARLSGTGERHQFEDVIPLDDSVDANLPGISEGASEIEIELMTTKFGCKFPPDPPLTPHPAWGFPFHNCCWEILSTATIYFGGDLDVQAIFDLCRSQPYRLGRLNWGHDYGGAIAYIDDIESLCPGEEPELHPQQFKTNTYMYNPLEIPELRCLFATEPRSHVSEQAIVVSDMRLEPSYDNDPFVKLPPEILQMIFVLMNSRDVANLRLASPVCALTALPDSFWRSRFWQGREFDYVFEANSSYPVGGSWRRLFEQTRALAKDPKMVNRRRIWSLAYRLCGLMSMRLSLDGCHGTPIHTIFEPGGITTNNSNWLTAGPTLSDPRSSFSRGSRALYERSVTIRDTPQAISISVTRINNKQFISGIRFRADGQDISLGYCGPTNKLIVTPEAYSGPISLVGFHVAFDYKGVRGLRILWSGEAHSDWIGDWSDVSHRVLFPSPSRLPLDLKGGFDALKLVSLSIYNEQEASSTRKDKSGHSFNLRDNARWYGEVPPKELSYLGPTHPLIRNHGSELPFSLALFGGIDGNSLPYLTEITVWVVDNTPYGIYADRTHIWAIEFCFSQLVNGQRSILLGRVPESPDSEVYRINLQSDEGERIVRLEALYEDTNFIFGFRIRTNRERCVEFPPSCTVLLREEDYFIDTLSPEGVLVGIYAVLVS